FAQLIETEKPDVTLAMATSAARDVTNGEALFALGEKYKIPIEIIPGHLEAKITYDGATYDRKNKIGVAAIDVGGGSTEVIALGENGEPQGVSVDVGSVRLTEMFVTGHPIQIAEVNQIKEYAVKKFFESKDQLPQASLTEIIGVAGTPTTLAAVMQGAPYSDELVHGYKISTNDLNTWINKLAAMDLKSRQEVVGMDPKRADVIVAGMCILLAALEALNKSELVVSIRGVRYGVAIHAAKMSR
ncbi:MAG: Ppx/GppA family phosphatase, partial [Bdellovibrionales bacterium]|nr:Ppx/GppA family phosphatase [Bdellovibrionales bacterium]